jgi:hypothetical protein
MPTYLIERTVPGAAAMTPDQLRDLSAHSNEVIAHLGHDIAWDHSYVLDDRICCVYVACDEQIVREHARCGGFPIDTVSEIATVISPATGRS